MQKISKKDFALLIYFWILTVLLVVFAISCNALDRDGNIIWNGARILKTTLLAVGTSTFVTILCYLLMTRVLNKKLKCTLNITTVTTKLPKWTWLAFPIIFLLWVPCFLAYFPGICSYDSEAYFFQFVYNAYNNHHPLAYTLLVRFFYNLGNNLLGSYTVGIALFTIVQMLLLAFSMTVFIRCIYKAYNKKWLFLLLTLLFGLHPMNAYMSVTMTKDIYFAAGMLLAFSALFTELFLQTGEYNKWINLSCFILGLILVVLFRSNGRYCILATLFVEIFCLIIFKTKRKSVLQLLVGTIIAFFIGMVLVSAIDKATNAQEVDKREMFSLPAQQIARVVHFHKNELSQDTMQQIETLIWPSSLYLYNQRTARFVKQDVISYEILHYPVKYLKLYLNLFKEYPGDYVNAFLGLYSGFLNPWDKSHIRINEDFDGVLAEDFHYIQTAFTVTDRFQVDHTPVSKTLHKFYQWYANKDIYMKIPLVSFLFVPGVHLWVMLYCFGILVYQKKAICCIPGALVFSYFLTFLLGPTVQLRYIFPIMICTPGIILFTLFNMRRNDNETNNSNSLL